MGNGITHVFAQNGYYVSLIDIDERALEKALIIISKNMDRQIQKKIISTHDKELALRRISTFTSIETGINEADFVVEAATENVQIKRKLFETMDAHAPKRAILTTNTSSISITKIAAATKRPEKVIGMHFMNPVPVMKLVEVIRGYATSDETTQFVIEVSKNLKKVPVVVNDYPGFVANRILMPMINEAIISLHEGIAGVEEIDTVMKLGMSHPMGPLQLADFIGLDVCLSILHVLYEGLGNTKYAPCPLLTNMVTAGYLGIKTEEGFYKYTLDSKEPKVSWRFK